MIETTTRERGADYRRKLPEAEEQQILCPHEGERRAHVFGSLLEWLHRGALRTTVNRRPNSEGIEVR